MRVGGQVGGGDGHRFAAEARPAIGALEGRGPAGDVGGEERAVAVLAKIERLGRVVGDQRMGRIGKDEVEGAGRVGLRREQRTAAPERQDAGGACRPDLVRARSEMRGAVEATAAKG